MTFNHILLVAIVTIVARAVISQTTISAGISSNGPLAYVYKGRLLHGDSPKQEDRGVFSSTED
ncbi:hypothetical protein PC116_g9613 [Phytophthora cactorum]|uniref:Uncharacterized protein n=1 Tax=Phytophthora cactorum TaxID=29920 RepID=A0A8T1KZF8_9STRA|nr:hypothetical protein Pcac1_g27416 [Phytophthora cactorum]KAG2810885.1 hypothetical protein PC111_g15460 [Phytophthora cactorum]KAG2886451.1 hypothetical protein PC114_g19247 [Phytophthora cactorum]KAG2947676.1 hypothetical protein PC117_g6624 [Phytophthora cactorum]KAG3003318.1 hypothetical protein PC120_g19183 [Phytophthora cactorum]